MTRQPIVYSLAGLLAGGIITALILLTAKPTAPISTSKSTDSPQTATLPNSTTVPNTSASVPFKPGMRGQTDQHFIVMMIPHHEDAVAMADLALNRAQHSELKTLARSIKAAQTREIQDMQTWYKQWYGTEVPEWQPGMGMNRSWNSSARKPGTSGMGRGHRGMMRMRTDLTALQNATDFDRAFIEEMIPHHRMAVMMGQMVLTNSQHPEIRNLAESIIKTQTAEINQMQQWYQAWYPS
ncbi:MAG: DUF305 domain-containing protein [Leptolyngbyaceae cyanobacterium CSU_1_3]|nr:DUF305 domain-containing protein [Leptolyngbyaceae cyanobacterium CSU_1_3]